MFDAFRMKENINNALSIPKVQTVIANYYSEKKTSEKQLCPRLAQKNNVHLLLVPLHQRLTTVVIIIYFQTAL